MIEVSYNDFEKLDVRVGEIVRAENYPEARKPAIKLWLDFGEDLGLKKSSAQISQNYKASDLIGRKVVAIVNFPPRQIGKFISEVLVLGVPDSKGQVVLLVPNVDVPTGGRVH
ncbi:MAG: tRNA-binding protein [Proteobacteria bacterium]|jgi:tRNA-binding protein|nr:tRNA-binding protein [Pseudomonadota bacterium]MDA1237979.1 tRNA-binding protein [Pseudomonadota bacterium]